MLLAGAAGFVAGLVTTVAGIGGGIALVAFLSGFLPPKEVVGLTAPVLLVGNATRWWMFRDHLDRPVAGAFLALGLPAAAVSALLLRDLPTRAVELGIAGVCLVFIVERLVRGARQLPRLPAPAFLAVGAVSGAVSAAAGGSGPLSAPFFQARGLVKEAFGATNAVCNGAVHAVKTLVFAGVGLLTLANLPLSGAAALGVVGGNYAGRVLLGRISERAFSTLLLLALTVIALRLIVTG